MDPVNDIRHVRYTYTRRRMKTTILLEVGRKFNYSSNAGAKTIKENIEIEIDL